jgi:hypothetical protein
MKIGKIFLTAQFFIKQSRELLSCSAQWTSRIWTIKQPQTYILIFQREIGSTTRSTFSILPPIPHRLQYPWHESHLLQASFLQVFCVDFFQIFVSIFKNGQRSVFMFLSLFLWEFRWFNGILNHQRILNW